MDIYHKKKQTKNNPRSCSYLLLKTLFYFISQCIFNVACVNKTRSWTTAILHLFSQFTDLVIKVIMKCVNVKLWDLLGCFHNILNAPRNIPVYGGHHKKASLITLFHKSHESHKLQRIDKYLDS